MPRGRTDARVQEARLPVETSRPEIGLQPGLQLGNRLKIGPRLSRENLQQRCVIYARRSCSGAQACASYSVSKLARKLAGGFPGRTWRFNVRPRGGRKLGRLLALSSGHGDQRRRIAYRSSDHEPQSSARKAQRGRREVPQLSQPLFLHEAGLAGGRPEPGGASTQA